jgi:hypothetical protein
VVDAAGQPKAGGDVPEHLPGRPKTDRLEGGLGGPGGNGGVITLVAKNFLNPDKTPLLDVSGGPGGRGGVEGGVGEGGNAGNYGGSPGVFIASSDCDQSPGEPGLPGNHAEPPTRGDGPSGVRGTAQRLISR